MNYNCLIKNDLCKKMISDITLIDIKILNEYSDDYKIIISNDNIILNIYSDSFLNMIINNFFKAFLDKIYNVKNINIHLDYLNSISSSISKYFILNSDNTVTLYIELNLVRCEIDYVMGKRDKYIYWGLFFLKKDLHLLYKKFNM